MSAWSLWPQFLVIASHLVGIGIAIARYGELKKPDSYGIWEVLLLPAFSLTILYYGGFFDHLLVRFQ